MLDVYTSKHGSARKGKRGTQRFICYAFLLSIASRYGMKCDRGRGSQEESPLRRLPVA